MEGLLFRRVGGAVVKLDSAVLARMHEFRQVLPHQKEAGGVLLGRRIQGCQDIVVDEVTCPMPGDFRHRVAFHRSRVPHQRAIDEWWRESQGTCQYLGEWHTHPELYPSPSWVDRMEWRRHLRKDLFEGTSLFFLIVGIQEVRAWEGTRHPLELVRLQPVEPRVLHDP